MKRIGAILKVPGKAARLVIGLALATSAFFLSMSLYRVSTAVQEVLWENQQLKEAISNISESGRIGYAKVLSQSVDAYGKVQETTLKFIETAAEDELRQVLEKEFTIPGDIVHFDALIVKFDNQMVIDGTKKSLYLWRRVYGEKTAPADGFEIESPGGTPQRYASLLKELPIKLQQDFWKEIWDLANNPEKLKSYGIEAIYGNVTYTRLKPKLLYIFRINATGQVYPEVIPEF